MCFEVRERVRNVRGPQRCRAPADDPLERTREGVLLDGAARRRASDASSTRCPTPLWHHCGSGVAEQSDGRAGFEDEHERRRIGAVVMCRSPSPGYSTFICAGRG